MNIQKMYDLLKDSCCVVAPEIAHKVASEIVEKEPRLLPEVISWRWEMELKRGTINFDPRNPKNYQQMMMGAYVKRIIPDRVQPETEKFSDSCVPVFLPFEQKYPNNFDFTMSKPGQKLLSMQVGGDCFDIYSSNSPLSRAPHTLVVPKEPRSHFLLPVDLSLISILREKYPAFHFIYSSMGGGAGVNHQHWHMMAGHDDYPILTRPITYIDQNSDISIGCYPEYPTDCYVLERRCDYKMEIEMEFIDYLQKNNVPHNLLAKQNYTWITPRSHTESTLIPGKKYGAWETILGVCNACSQAQYNLIEINIFEQALREIQLKQADREELTKKLKSLACRLRRKV
jgi:hypothetical protein